MCGIVGYIGNKQAYPIIIEGLKRLEYRGYDSAGIALLNENKINILKKKGKVVELEKSILNNTTSANIGIGHTRWATHGEPSDKNAHPFFSASKKLAIIHNGIIENYNVLKKELQSKNYTFESDTDTEVLINFIEDIQIQHKISLEEALRIALKRVVGAYCILIISEDEPNTIIAARKGSPLVIGIGKNEHFLGSDASPFIEYTNEVVYINDYEIAIVKPTELILKNIGNEIQTPLITKLDLELASIEKNGYDHFMLKEIMEQPETINDCLRGRVLFESKEIKMAGIEKYIHNFKNAQRIIIVSCGTSWHAGLYAEYIIEELCRIPVEVEYASEFRYRNPIIYSGDIIIAISQSGETADTLVALEKAKKQGAIIFGIVNVVGSSIARISHAGIYTHAGHEIGVASTKAFTAQLIALNLLALKIAQYKETISTDIYTHLFDCLSTIPKQVVQIWDQIPKIKEIANKFKQANNFLYLGRGFNFPIALEGALKLKEISYIHAEGYPAAEMKHGPIALVDENLPVFFIATKDNYYDKIISNMQEIKARKGQIIAIATNHDKQIKDITNEVIYVPEIHPILAPILNVIPLQLFSYYVGIGKELDVDKPRNLAKSVTVE